jgi:lipopolysaccharide export LptBFGC system permease protein LptF
MIASEWLKEHAGSDVIVLNGDAPFIDSETVMAALWAHRDNGNDVTVITAEIELWPRLINPLAIIVMTLIGVAIAARKSRGGIGMHLAIGISIAFAFIVFMKITTVFATNGDLSPFLAVLLPQIIFSIAAGWLIYKAPK